MRQTDQPTNGGQHESPAGTGRAAPSPKTACRFCSAPLEHVVVDLGLSPLCQNRVTQEQLAQYEPFYPLKAYVCGECFLVQVLEHVSGEEIFSHYAYFSSYSDSWLAHAERYVDMAVSRFGLGKDSQVIEVASNDGYLLQFIVKKGIPALGIEPAANVGEAAKAKGVTSIAKFFGRQTATELAQAGTRADLLIANNVLAHVPDLNDFVGGMEILLKEDGVITVEFPHLMRLFEENQFDTIYQEHYCYFSLLTLQRVFDRHNLTIFDVEEIPTHGGSLRIYVRHKADANKPVTDAVGAIYDREVAAGLTDLATYTRFGKQVEETKRKLLEFLIRVRREGKQVVGYGAPGKGNTLLNYCGIRQDFIDYTVDRNPMKQNTFLPGSRIPVYGPEKIEETQPDYVLILPWNLKDEIMGQLEHIRSWGGQFVIPIPELAVYS